jgi:nucleoside phosphorylase
MASGSVVVADKNAKEVAEQESQVMALDMEAVPFYAASRYSSIGGTQLICLKSVCDKADDQKIG